MDGLTGVMNFSLAELEDEQIDMDAGRLADEVLAEVASAEGITVEQLLADMTKRAVSNPRAFCVQPHEIEQLNSLGDERRDHIAHCSFCQVLLRDCVASEARAIAYAKQVCQPARHSKSFLSSFCRQVLGILNHFGFFRSRKSRRDSAAPNAADLEHSPVAVSVVRE